ncbi:unnamed protein product [Soboliphyme baturini]|uniref:DUF2428 domain-containing protein n=1 Tax=Soboliphyme baturini TaxID=241478 RepID=A0A183IVV0_9BILA|nr:unnamed protein product [Soboliphyme baturini]
MRQVVSAPVVDHLLFCTRDKVAVRCFQLMCSRVKRTWPIEASDLQRVRKFVVLNCLSGKKFFMENLTAAVLKKFLCWLLEFSFSRLKYFADKECRKMSLKFIKLLLPLGESVPTFENTLSERMKHFQHDWPLLLISCLGEEFANNQDLALEILNAFPRHLLSIVDFPAVFESSIAMAESSKLADVSSASYLIRFVTLNCPTLLLPNVIVSNVDLNRFACTERNLAVVLHFLSNRLLVQYRKEQASPSGRFSFHGIIRCITGIVSECRFRKLDSAYVADHLQHLVVTCKAICSIVSQAVNYSSPEGYIPLEYGEEDYAPQSFLVNCWRSLKEINELFELIFSCYAETLPDQTKSAILSHFFRMFAQNRHMGLTQASSGPLLKLCVSMSGSKLGFDTIQRWISTLKEMIKVESPLFCDTRRSAGLPVIFRVCLEATLRGSHLFFDETTKFLMDGVSSSSTMGVKSQVHCLNILRMIFRESVFHKFVGPFIGDALVASIASLGSGHWPLRNAAILFYSAVMQRTFGAPAAGVYVPDNNR